MKTTRTLALLMGLIATFVIVSCHKNDVLTSNADEANAKAAPASIVENSIPLSVLPDCNSHCINPEGPYVELTGSQTNYYGNPSNPQHSKTVSYVTYNTATSFVVKVTFVHNGGNASDLISVTALGSTQPVATLASGNTATFTFTLPVGWSACMNVPFSIRQEGQSAPLNISASYNLYGVCAARGCETSFTGETIVCGTGTEREVVYTFTSKDEQTYFKIQGGITNFTGIEDADVEVLGGSNIEKWQGAPGGSTNHIIRVEGSVEACETISIKIKWNSTNSGGIITGSWSVKDGNGVELAPSVAGLACGN